MTDFFPDTRDTTVVQITKLLDLEQDAARYRWLRDAIYIDPKMLILRIDKVFLRGPLPEALDSAIDDAIDVAVDKAMKA